MSGLEAVFFMQVKNGMDKINSILENISDPINKAVTGAAYLKEAIGSVIQIKKEKPRKVKNL